MSRETGCIHAIVRDGFGLYWEHVASVGVGFAIAYDTPIALLTYLTSNLHEFYYEASHGVLSRCRPIVVVAYSLLHEVSDVDKNSKVDNRSMVSRV